MSNYRQEIESIKKETKPEYFKAEIGKIIPRLAKEIIKEKLKGKTYDLLRTTAMTTDITETAFLFYEGDKDLYDYLCNFIASAALFLTENKDVYHPWDYFRAISKNPDKYKDMFKDEYYLKQISKINEELS